MISQGLTKQAARTSGQALAERAAFDLGYSHAIGWHDFDKKAGAHCRAIASAYAQGFDDGESDRESPFDQVDYQKELTDPLGY